MSDRCGAGRADCVACGGAAAAARLRLTARLAVQALALALGRLATRRGSLRSGTRAQFAQTRAGSAERPAGTVGGRGPARPEVRRHVGRRPRPHQGGRRPHRPRPGEPGDDVVVVVSAMGKTTDDLVRLAHDVSHAPAAREMDMLLTAGERISIALLCMAIIDHGEPGGVASPARRPGIVTDTTHTARRRSSRSGPTASARRSPPATSRSSPASRACRPTATSRRSAAAAPTPPRSALAAALGAEACEIYTDVAGVYTADPRVVPDARRLAAAVVRRDARDGRDRRPGARAAVGGVRAQPRRAASTSARASPGSRARGSREEGSERWNRRSSPVSRTTRRRPRSRSTQVPDRPGVAATVFRALADEAVNVDMIVQNVSTAGHTDISFTVPHDDLHARARGDGEGRRARSAPAASATTPASAGSRSSARA